MKSKWKIIFQTAGAALLAAAILFSFTGCPPGADSVDKTALGAKITEAEDLLADTPGTGTNASQILLDRWFASESAKTTFNNAIDAAQTVYDNANATQAQVNSAVTTLTSAITTFNNARAQGTMLPNQDALNVLIAEAEDALDDITVSTNGSNVDPGDFWVTQAVYDALETAINTAKAVTSDFAAACTALQTALDTFNAAKQPGTIPPSNAAKSITITGLGSYNGLFIQAGLFQSEDELLDSMGGSEPEIYGLGEVINNQAVIEIYEQNGRWTGTGSWYAAFMLFDDMQEEYIGFFISINTINFNTANVTKSFDDFRHLSFGYTFGEIYQIVTTETMPGTINTVDTWFGEIFGGTYAEWKAYFGLSIYSNEAMTAEYSGNSSITASSPVYMKVPLEMLMGGGIENRGEKIGEISGTVTLQNIPANARVYLQAYGSDGNSDYFNTNSIRLNVSQDLTNIPFTIFVYERDCESGVLTGKTWNITFTIYVDLSNNLQSYNVRSSEQSLTFTGSDLPAAAAGSLGTFDLDTVTLTGTINISYNDGTVGWLDIQASTQGPPNISGGQNIIPSGKTNIPFTILIPKSVAGYTVSFRINGRPSRNSDWDDRIFDIERVFTINNLPAGGQTGITIDIGNLVPDTITVKNAPVGTYTVYIVNTFYIQSNYSNIVNNNQNVVAKGSGSGASITLTENNINESDGWFSVLIVSDSGSRYTNYGSSYVNGIGVLDWNTMQVYQP